MLKNGSAQVTAEIKVKGNQQTKTYKYPTLFPTGRRVWEQNDVMYREALSEIYETKLYISYFSL